MMSAGTAIKVVADAQIPHLAEVCAGWCELELLDAASITPQALRDADALLVRSVNRVDAELLEGSNISFVGSATAGTDHLDLAALDAAGITVASAPGCNANAVTDYVLAAIFECLGNKALAGTEVGVFGYGNVGRRLVGMLQVLGIPALVYDPLLDWQAVGKPAKAQVVDSAADILGCEVVTLHVPLTKNCEHATFHMLDAAALGQLGERALLVNSSRGAVVDNNALAAHFSAGWQGRAVLDVWEGEPAIHRELLQRVSIATPHIAGYSRAAKLRATLTVVAAMQQCLAANNRQAQASLHGALQQLAQARREILQPCDAQAFAASVKGVCKLAAQTAALKSATGKAMRSHKGASLAESFTAQRKAYVLREEHAYDTFLPPVSLPASPGGQARATV